MRRAVFGAVIVLACGAGSAEAQLRQPRCGGWPPLRHSEGMAIGAPGSTCYGQVFDSLPPRMALASIRVKSPPAHSRFAMIGEREFEFTPSSSLRGMDQVVLATEWIVGGKHVSRDRRIVLTTDEEFEKAGGTRNNAPDGHVVNRLPSGRGTGQGRR